MKEDNDMDELVNGKFRFVSLGKNLLNQKAWLLIIKFMREELEHALASQGVDSIFCLEDTSSFHICKINNEENSKGDIIFHVTNSVIKDLKSHNVREIFEEIGTPIVTIGNSRIAFWVNMTIFPDKVDFAVAKKVAEHFSHWILDVNPDSFVCSYSIPFFLFISCYIHGKHYIDATFRDLQDFFSPERYSTFSDFERRVLKPVKEDYDRAYEKGVSEFTFTYKTKDKTPIGKKGSALINIELINAAPKKRREPHINYSALQAMEKNNKFNKYIQLLEVNKNLILTGAPGTGKTFLAREIAKAMGCMEEQIGFIQFHPNYDYTDFIEGLRPISDKNGNIGFKRQNGAFKEFCKLAISQCVQPTKTESDAVLQKFKIMLRKKGGIEIRGIYFMIDEGETIHFMFHRTSYVLRDKDLLEYISDKENCLYNAFTKLVGDYAVANYFVPTNLKNEDIKKFVFVIDEINRGEISKIFGEAFSSIDSGYRGEKGKVQTQYQNMIDNDDVFKDGFYVPENVYIIGTMNDIDRSVESMDFAMRRRFAFVEVTTEESYQNMIAESNDYDKNEKVEIKKRMSALNKSILMPELKLGEAYQIGAAYFRKYLSYKHLGMEQAFKMLWNYHLKGLLFEYLRGNQNAKAYLDELEKAYNKKHETNDETDKDNG